MVARYAGRHVPASPLDLLARSAELPHGAERVGLCEEAAEKADALGNLELGYLAREKLVEAAIFAGHPEKALVAFAWLLGRADDDPERFPEQDLLWYYKWVAAELPDFAEVTLERIRSVYADMERRYVRCGYSLRPVHKLRWLEARARGEREEARAHFERFRVSPRDAGADCFACELDDEVLFLVDQGRDAEAVDRAAPILSGEAACASVPAVTWATLLLPLVRLGRREEAVEIQRRGYPQVVGRRHFVRVAADHLEFLSLAGEAERATAAFLHGLPLALETSNQDDRFRFLRAACVYARTAAPAVARLPSLPPRSGAPRSSADARCAREALFAWLHEVAVELAGRFDARNGSDAYARRLAGSLARAADPSQFLSSSQDPDGAGPDPAPRVV
ncbi:MAG: hypothetical protein D6731_09885 [Planctomycetota bacterium]|nr:MAG: hypothetical protein D6731_09885 [Planctomycetota bacterium]